MSSFWRRVAVAAAVMTAVAACETRVPEQAFSWAPQTPAEQQLTTRWFETRNEDQVVRAAADVLRSAGYEILDTSEEQLGLLVATRETDETIGEVLQDFGEFVVVATLTLGKAGPAIQKSQEIRVAVLVHGDQRQRTYVQAIFQRLVWNSDDEGRTRILDEHAPYLSFFSKLSSALSLEAQEP